MPDPLATLAALDLEERRLTAELLALQARRSALVADLVLSAPAAEPLIEAEALVAKWAASGLPGCPPTEAALRKAMQRARSGGRWQRLLKAAEDPEARTLRWRWPEAERAIREETGT